MGTFTFQIVKLCFVAPLLASALGNTLDGYSHQPTKQQGFFERSKVFLDNEIIKPISDFFGWNNEETKNIPGTDRRFDIIPVSSFRSDIKNPHPTYMKNINQINNGENIPNMNPGFRHKFGLSWKKGKNLFGKLFGKKRLNVGSPFTYPNYKSPGIKRNNKAYIPFVKNKNGKIMKMPASNHASKNNFRQNSNLKLKVPTKSRNPLSPVYKINRKDQMTQEFKKNLTKSDKLYNHIARKKNFPSKHMMMQEPSPSVVHLSYKNAPKLQAPLSSDTKNYLEKKISAHPYPFVGPNQKRNYHLSSKAKPSPKGNQFKFGGQKNRPMILKGLASQPSQTIRKRTKNKGLFDNVKIMANNFFNRFLQRSSTSRIQRRQQGNLEGRKTLAQTVGQESVIRTPLETINFISPSPQQGIIAENAFQPIFVPSQSVYGKETKDGLTPMILPQKRKDEVKEEKPKEEPKLVDFFEQ